MADNRRGKNNGAYYLSRGQLFVLGVGFTITSVVVFLLGILIGQGIEERKLVKKEEPLVKIPVQPLAPGPSTKEEMTFYDTLTKGPTGEQTARTEPAKEVKRTEEKVKPPVKETKAVQEEKTPAAQQKVKEKVSTEKTAPIAETKKEVLPQKATKAEPTQTETGTKERVWTVQVNAYPQEKDAKSLAKKLKDRGYDAYVVSTDIKGKTWHRVRVGRLGTREEAQELQEVLKRKENLTKSIIASR